MTRELESETPFHHVIEIAKRLDYIRGQERVDREAKKPQGLGGFSGFYFVAQTHHGIDSISQPVQSAR